jgi:hypothetical protein
VTQKIGKPDQNKYRGVVERFIAPVLKTGDVKASGGSNPSSSANQNKVPRKRDFLLLAWPSQTLRLNEGRTTTKESKATLILFDTSPTGADVVCWHVCSSFVLITNMFV